MGYVEEDTIKKWVSGYCPSPLIFLGPLQLLFATAAA
jgi:hypothetical protein